MPKKFSNPALQRFIDIQEEDVVGVSVATEEAIDSISPVARTGKPRATPKISPNLSLSDPRMKLNPLYVETKSRHMHLLMQPSLYERLKARAENEGLSVNECIHGILEQALL
jgi:predicted HicB family RNase H-like nuclease